MASRVRAGAAVVLLAGVMASCGSSKPSHTAVLHLGGSPGASATSLPAGTPNPCQLFGESSAASLAGEQVQTVGGDPAYVAPNVICEYVPASAQHVKLSVLIFEATKLASADASAEYAQIMRMQVPLHVPVDTVTALSSPGYPGWSSGPARTGNESTASFIATCGFAHRGYTYFFWGRWSGPSKAPSSSTVTGLCQQIHSRLA